MALEHAILVSLSERPAAGVDLVRRFDRSIGFFWSATHQQIYRTLSRMESDGWVRSRPVAQQGRRGKVEYVVAAAGRTELRRWLAEPAPAESFRSDLAVRLRAASYGDRRAVLEDVAAHRAEHATRLAHYEHLAVRDFPEAVDAGAGALEQQRRDVYLVLRGGIRLERFWVEWLTEYLLAHGEDAADEPPPSDHPARPETTGSHP